MKKLFLVLLLAACSSQGEVRRDNSAFQDEMELDEATKNMVGPPTPAMDSSQTDTDGLEVSEVDDTAQDSAKLHEMLKKKALRAKSKKLLPFCKKLMVADQKEPFCLTPKKGRNCFCHRN